MADATSAGPPPGGGARGPARRRRVAAAGALVVCAATLAAAVVGAARDPRAGLLVLAGLLVATWLAWRGAAHGPRRRPWYLVGAALVVTGAVAALLAGGQLLAPV
ncbi:MAG TPA: hypothetical protein VI318_07495, partial [Baekduia sp.]